MTVLTGTRVVEFAQGVAGPLAALRLGDLGAAVVKVEHADGDWMRGTPPLIPTTDASATFLALNRGKRSLALGATPGKAAPVLQSLLSHTDVLITDRSDAALEALGLGAFLANPPANPRLVIVDISPWGRNGPLANAPGSELAAQAMAGYTRYLGTAAEPPRRLGADAAGAGTGMFAVQAVLAALFWRTRSGGGQRVSLSLFNSLLSLKSIQLAAQSDPDVYAGPRIGGPQHPPEHGWHAADRSFFFMFGGSVGAAGRPGWEGFVEEMGMAHLRDDPRFDSTGRDSTGHGVNVHALRPVYEESFAGHSAEALVAAIRRHGGSAAVYFGADETLAHPQTQALDVVRDIPFGEERTTPACRFPARFSELEPGLAGGVAKLGQHSEEIAAELGFDAAAFAALCRQGALLDPRADVPAGSGQRRVDGRSE